MLLIFGVAPTVSAFSSPSPELVPKWSRFESSFRSVVNYPNPLADCTFKAEFISPSGETNRVPGFWDGGRVWRIRFNPDQAGRWSFRTSCSDSNNSGLHQQKGEFLCVASVGSTRFLQHGTIQTSRTGSHFEHRDGTPFLWLADSVGPGASVSRKGDWEYYCEVRSHQQFTATHWFINAGKDSEDEPALIAAKGAVPNPKFFQNLDRKIEIANRAGLLNVITPLWNSPNGSPRLLSDRQREQLTRYAMARWGGDHVAWLLGSENAKPQEAQDWEQMGEKVFSEHRSSVVLLFQSRQSLSKVKAPPWVDGFAVPNDSAPARESFSPLAPIAPLVRIASARENSVIRENFRSTAEAVWTEIWLNLLTTHIAGVSYAAHGVVDWNSSVTPEADLMAWQKSLFLPGAKQMQHLSALLNSIPYWELIPAPELVVRSAAKGSLISAATQTASRDLGLFYIASGSALELSLKALPDVPKLSWFNPRNGQTSDAVAVIGPESVTLPTPGPGDWLLVVKGSK